MITKCCFCDCKLEEYEGNNPAPVKKKGVCCMICNIKIVIPARINERVGRSISK